MTPELIVMLTHNDVTVPNAAEIFAECRNTSAKYWGFKEVGLPFEEMKALCAAMKDAGKTTFLEVVAYTEEECLQGAEMAVKAGFDFLMGTMYFDSVRRLALKHQLKYLPFVGKIYGRPSVLDGTIEEIVEEGRQLAQKEGVYGFDLLGYRFTGDACQLNQEFVRRMEVPVCLAGSISSYERLDEVKQANPWTFTIGGAFFEHRFGEGFGEQIDRVVAYMRQGKNA